MLRIGGAIIVAAILMNGACAEKRNCTLETKSMDKDRQEILGHIHGIFQAFLRQDREALRRMHTHDWIGFQGPSVKIERGIEDYMVNAEKSLQSLQGTRYELLDTEVQFCGDVALVFYVARYDFRNRDGREGSMRLRSIDIYRRENGHWNQAGSHITPIRPDGAWGEGRSTSPDAAGADGGAGGRFRTGNEQETTVELTTEQRQELFSARESVWRAWFANDESALHVLLPAEAIAIDPGVSAWADRDEILRRSAAFASGGKLLRLEFPETRMQVFGNVVILYTKFLFETERDGRCTEMRGRGTEVFVHRGGRWLNSAWHLEPETDAAQT